MYISLKHASLLSQWVDYVVKKFVKSVPHLVGDAAGKVSGLLQEFVKLLALLQSMP